MAPLKRKYEVVSTSSKTTNKRRRSQEKPAFSPKSTKPRVDSEKETVKPDLKPQKQAQASLLSKDQAAFPRGGADVLTPIERRQISAKATRDATKEHMKSQGLFDGGNNLSDGSDEDDEDADSSSDPIAAPKATKKVTKKKSQQRANRQETTIKIAGLSHKKLTVGSLIFGQIIAIGDHNMKIALPNNLVGYVPLTAISAGFSQKIENLLNQDNNKEEKEDDSEDDDQDIRLQDHFRIGQHLRVVVTATGNSTTASKHPASKRLELSIEPALTNVGLKKSTLTPNCTVQASVSSIEDHGLVVDLALEDDQVRGFIPKNALPAGISVENIQTGSVFLCTVVNIGSNGKIVKLSADLTKATTLRNASSVDAFLPGSVTEILITQVTDWGVSGKVMGMIDVTADMVHSGSFKDKENYLRQFEVGKKIDGRLIYTFALSDNRRLGFSVLDHVLKVGEQTESTTMGNSLKFSSSISDAVVIRVEPGIGIYLSLSLGNIGFAHISRLSDKKVDSVSESVGKYKIGTQHNARILDFNPIDGLYMVSLQQSILDQPYLRVADVNIGDVIKGTITKISLGATGVEGLIVEIAEGITGFVPQLHMSDVVLERPEKKFREGQAVTARVLSTNLSKKSITLTLKKSLVNSEEKMWSDFDVVSVGDSSMGTLIKVDKHGALIQFSGPLKGFLPVSEMSEAYIKDAREHFRVGQVLSVTALSVNAERKRLTVSCRGVKATSSGSDKVLSSLVPGTLTSGVVFEKSEDDVLLRLEGSDVIGHLALDFIADGSLRKRQSALSKIRVGQRLDNILILDVQMKRRLVTMCNKHSLIDAAREGQLLKSFEDLREGTLVTGFVSNISTTGVFVSFAGGISGLIPAKQVSIGKEEDDDFGMQKFQPVTAKVTNIDYKGATPRFWLTMRQTPGSNEAAKPNLEETDNSPQDIEAPVDESIKSRKDLAVGRISKARIISARQTQLNVDLAKGVQGRVDVSEVFDNWEDIEDHKKPLKDYSPGQVISVRVLGVHDSRNHRFLPLTHRSGKGTVYELSTKPSSLDEQTFQQPSYDDMKVGTSWLAFVNNVAEDCLWVSISPSVRGRVRAVDVSDHLSLAGDLENNFPIGSAIRVRVQAIDLEKQRLDLTARTGEISKTLTLQDLTNGLTLPGRVTKVSERQILVQLSENIVGAVDLIDMADDYTAADPAKYEKNQILRVSVVHIDSANKRILLSTRPSKVLSSSLPVADPEISSIDQLQVNDVYRGFVTNVADKGIFVMLGHGITAFVRVAHLSDAYLKEWKDQFQRDQLVKGKIILVEKGTGHIQMSLKHSIISSDYVPPTTFNDLHVGDIVTGKIAKVETFGVFIVVDNSQNLRGMCHRSEIAEHKVEDVSNLYSEGDSVKAKVLKLDPQNRRINFGLKASYFNDEVSEGGDEVEDEDVNVDEEDQVEGGVSIDEILDDAGSEEESDEIIELGNAHSTDTIMVEGEGEDDISKSTHGGLKVGGFDWYGLSENASKRDFDQTSPQEESLVKKRKKRAGIEVDRTGDLDAHGPQSVDDYERLLLGEPNSSLLWLQYMAFHLDLGDVDQARETGERALRSIGLGQDVEKMNIWIALLNLESVHGDDDSIEAIFKRACEYNDPQDIHTRLSSIYIQSGKHDKADDLFQRMVKKFAQDPKVWINYATFLFDTMSDAEKARALLPRALQVLPKFSQVDLTSKFAQLEFKSEAGLPERGRTIFEGLISSFPKRVDLFNVLLDLEIKSTDATQIRGVFERILSGKLKPKQAKHFFKRWLSFEEEQGDDRKIEEVKVRAAAWIRAAVKEPES